MLADELDYVVGVDTHLEEHVLAVVVARSGAVLARRAVRANARGYSAVLRFAGEAAIGVRVWAIEGTGSYGAGLARYLAGRGETVLEISRTPRAERRLCGKDDSLDAARTARAALASETLALPRSACAFVRGDPPCSMNHSARRVHPQPFARRSNSPTTSGAIPFGTSLRVSGSRVYPVGTREARCIPRSIAFAPTRWNESRALSR
jgi:Transposase